MKPLIVLVTVFILAAAAIRLIAGHDEAALAARIALSAMLAFTAIGHFAFTKGMAMMLPRFLPCREHWVRATGVIELLAAAGLHIPALTAITGWLLIAFFVLVLPANILAALQRIDYQKADTNGPGAGYLWFRVPLQLLFILWTYWSAIDATGRGLGRL